MYHLPEYLALARPFSEFGRKNVERAIATKLIVEVRIGTGPIDNVPTRVLGFCACAADAISILERSLRRSIHVHLFSSALKIASLSGSTIDSKAYLPALAALAGGLRLAGFKGSLSVDLAQGSREIQVQAADLLLPGRIKSFLDQAADANGNGADPIGYALEHASPSMYGDILEPGEPDILRITVGGKPEAKFWAIRQRVMMHATRNGFPVSASFGLILRTLARPWYSPEPYEPLLADLIESGTSSTVEALKRSCNPSRGGNAGLRREARNAATLVATARAGHLAEAVLSSSQALDFLRRSDLRIGRTLSELTVQ
jgi:hypothetical protein